LASANHKGTVSIINAKTGLTIKTLEGHQRRVWQVAFSPDGTVLASGGEDRLIKLWNPKTGDEIRTLEGHKGHVSSVVFSRDGKNLYSADLEDTLRGTPPDGAGDTIRIWDVATGKQLAETAAPLTHWLSLSPDGKLLVSADRF